MSLHFSLYHWSRLSHHQPASTSTSTSNNNKTLSGISLQSDKTTQSRTHPVIICDSQRLKTFKTCHLKVILLCDMQLYQGPSGVWSLKLQAIKSLLAFQAKMNFKNVRVIFPSKPEGGRGSSFKACKSESEETNCFIQILTWTVAATPCSKTISPHDICVLCFM